MFLTRLMLAARCRAGRDPAAALDALHRREDFQRILLRERARSDRSGEVFSLVVFTVGREPAGRDALATLHSSAKAAAVERTTPAGWPTGRSASFSGHAGRGGLDRGRRRVRLRPGRTVHCRTAPSTVIPSDWLTDEELTADAEYEEPGGRHGRSARWRTLFVRRLPLWKRGLDLLGAASGLLALSPLLAVVAAAVKLTSPGPVFFRQKRSGLGGKEFLMLKFRSMAADAEQPQEQSGGAATNRTGRRSRSATTRG